MKKIFLFLVLGCLFAASAAQAAVKMPEFTLPDATTGQQVKSDTFAGKAVLVTFFASWCPTCLQEIPILMEMQNKFAPQGFSLVGLSVDQDGASAVQRLIRRASVNFPVLLADMSVVESFGGVYMIPVSFLVNRSGQVVKKYPGPVPASILEKDIRSVLQ